MEHKSLVDYFMEKIVDPVVEVLKDERVFSKGFVIPLKLLINEFGLELMSAIERSISSFEVNQTVERLLNEVIISEKNSSPHSTEEQHDLSGETISTAKMALLGKHLSSDTIRLFSLSRDNTDFSNFSSNLKETPFRKRGKRSLADTVQMLSKESPLPLPPLTSKLPYNLSLPFVFPPVGPPLPDTSMMKTWIEFPSLSPIYQNSINMLNTSMSSDEQMSTLMKVSIQAANIINTISLGQAHTNLLQMDSENNKVSIKVYEKESRASSSPSNGDFTGSESSLSSSGTTTSPTSGEGDSVLEKPFMCMQVNCGKRFANKFLLKKHMFIHTGLRPHICPHCNKKFNRKDNLLRHKKTHIPEGYHPSPSLYNLPFRNVTPIISSHNFASAHNFREVCPMKRSLENGATAVRSLS